MNDDLEEAAKFIKNGHLVAFPTETVYGLGADATNEQAVQKIFKTKGRPSNNPLIVHVKDLDQALEIAEFSSTALKLAKNFWPGPLTIVANLKGTSFIANSVTSGLKTIAIRVPAHPIALKLINSSGVPIAAPSANPSGYISSTSYEHVIEHFSNQDIAILGFPNNSASKCIYGIESTIIDTSSDSLLPSILRLGFITKEAIENCININSLLLDNYDLIRAPGMLYKHYSPRAPLRMEADSLAGNELGLNFGDSKLIDNYNLNLSVSGDLIEGAANLYDMLRRLDCKAQQLRYNSIAVAPIPCAGLGLAINDRLKRAAA